MTPGPMFGVKIDPRNPFTGIFLGTLSKVKGTSIHKLHPLPITKINEKKMMLFLTVAYQNHTYGSDRLKLRKIALFHTLINF